MMDYDANMMSDDELAEAAEKIFTIQESDFEKIQSEKWFQSLFHAITLNQDGKRFAVKSVCSLAKLQKLFMNIYVKNYRESHNQLNMIVDAVIKNSEAIKKLYGACVLKLEEQQSLLSLEENDKIILALFLGDYRDSNDEIPVSVKTYNRGVLSAIGQHIPDGTLDDHQIRKLKNPKVVYRCFMEQCAVDGTIDSQEWSDKIYEDLMDFELSENSKREIKESVKREVEIAGAEYFFSKYSQGNAGVFDTDFVIDFEGSSGKKTIENQEYNEVLSDIINTNNEMHMMTALSGFNNFVACMSVSSLVFDAVSLGWLDGEELTRDLSEWGIMIPFLTDSIKQSIDDELGFLHHGYSFDSFDDDLNEQKTYFLVTTINGLFFFIRNRIAFVEYAWIQFVKQETDAVIISAKRVDWYSKSGTKEVGDEIIRIERNTENARYLRALRKLIEGISSSGGFIESPDRMVEDIVGQYIRRISKGSTSVAYMADDCTIDDKNAKRLKNALEKYAHKVREGETIGFIDTSLLGNGGSGLLFSKYGMAFDYAFEKVFVKYEEIEEMTIRKGKDLVLYGRFSERKDDSSNPSISNIYFDLEALKECIEKIQCVV